MIRFDFAQVYYKGTSFFSNWRNTSAKDSCMYTTKICLDWLPPHYNDCGWYLDCLENACLSNEKAIRPINDTKKI